MDNIIDKVESSHSKCKIIYNEIKKMDSFFIVSYMDFTVQKVYIKMRKNQFYDWQNGLHSCTVSERKDNFKGEKEFNEAICNTYSKIYIWTYQYYNLTYNINNRDVYNKIIFTNKESAERYSIAIKKYLKEYICPDILWVYCSPDNHDNEFLDMYTKKWMNYISNEWMRIHLWDSENWSFYQTTENVKKAILSNLLKCKESISNSNLLLKKISLTNKDVKATK